MTAYMRYCISSKKKYMITPTSDKHTVEKTPSCVRVYY